jgi:hypothetical protein
MGYSKHLIRVLQYLLPDDRFLSINLPNQILVFDVKEMTTVIDHTVIF